MENKKSAPLGMIESQVRELFPELTINLEKYEADDSDAFLYKVTVLKDSKGTAFVVNDADLNKEYIGLQIGLLLEHYK